MTGKQQILHPSINRQKDDLGEDGPVILTSVPGKKCTMSPHRSSFWAHGCQEGGWKKPTQIYQR